MSEAGSAGLAAERGTAANCCNGRVGRQMVEAAVANPEIRQFIHPTGVELIQRGLEAGLRAGDTVNCCNGRVGRGAMEELVTALGGA
jgi:hypothetical protein